MNRFVAAFREAVETGQRRQEKMAAIAEVTAAGHLAVAGSMTYVKIDADEPRPVFLRHPEFHHQRLWAARAVGLLIGGKPASMTIVSSAHRTDYLTQQLEFGSHEDGRPIFSIRRTMYEDQTRGYNELREANNWARVPERNPAVIDRVVLPEKAVEDIDHALRVSRLIGQYTLPDGLHDTA